MLRSLPPPIVKITSSRRSCFKLRGFDQREHSGSDMRQQHRPGGHQRGKFRFVFFGDSVLVRCLAISGGFRGVASGRLRTDSSMKTGTPGRIRTCDLRIRNPLLYPAELRGRETPRDAAGRARDRTAWESRPRPCLSFFFRGGPRHASALKRRIPIRGTTSTQIAAHHGLTYT